MQVVFGLLLVFLVIGLSARKFTSGLHWLIIFSVCVMIVVITFTHYGG